MIIGFDDVGGGKSSTDVVPILIDKQIIDQGVK
jgi:hypothetical protein